MVILSIETSCDDTCIAVIETKGQKNPCFKILANIVSSQVKIHAKYGGIYPTLAKREHQRNLPLVLKKAQSKANNSKIDLITVTKGPGLEPCLWTGINFAKELALEWKLPIVPVNHIEGHIFANFVSSNLKLKTKNAKLQLKIKNLFPAICLIVSGGHTQLILMKDIGKYKILGETRDDAAGECFDKTARILGLGYPGGPAISAEVIKHKIQDTRYKIQLPRPMIYQKNYDFSFSGLKTAVLTEIKKKKRKGKKFIKTMCWEIQQAIIDVLIYKTLKAAKDYQVKTIILGGGVIANTELQKQFKIKIKKEIPNFKLYIPKPNMCTDNAVMIGITAYFNQEKKTKNFAKIKADANLRI